jgi:hypothetical protein
MRCKLTKHHYWLLEITPLFRSNCLHHRHYYPVGVFSFRQITRTHPTNHTVQHLWLQVVVESWSLQRQGACLHHCHGKRRLWRRLRYRCNPHSTYLLQTRVILWIFDHDCPLYATYRLFVCGFPSPICRLAVEHDMARSIGQLSSFQYVTQELRSIRFWPHKPRTLLPLCVPGKLCLLLDSWIPFHRPEYVQLGLLDRP